MSLVQMRTAMNSLPMGVVILSSDGSSKWSNRAIYGLFPAGSADFATFMARVDELLAEALRGRTKETTLEFGEPMLRTLEITSLSLIDGGSAVIVEDVTKRVMTDRVRTDFVANISHELRTPIGAVSLMAENLVAETKDTDVARMAGVILSEVSRLNDTIGDLLELARIEFDGLANMTTVEVMKVVEEAVARLKSAALAKSVMIAIEDFPEASVMGDRAQLVSAIGNLLDNAVKFSPIDSSIEVTVDGHEVRVVDHGPGVSDSDKPQVFTRFFRAEATRSLPGSGLGLSIVKQFADDHGANVEVLDTPGGGATFVLRLPTVVASR